ncbi:MAG: HAMP domain-containing protein [Planctomyces sp.]|nr:HAMP domain-containing protein [Planctomyces sp.]
MSFRWRMTIWNAVAFAAVLIAFGFLVYGLLHRVHLDQIDAALDRRAAEIAADPRLAEDSPAALQAWFEERLEWSASQAALLDAAGRQLAAPPIGRAAAAEPANSFSPRFETTRDSRDVRVRRLLRPLSLGGQTFTLAVSASLDHLDEEMDQVRNVILATAPATLAVGAALAYLLACAALAPIQEIRRRTDEITAERLDRRLPEPAAADELGQLAHTINSLIGRLEQSFGQVRRFTADASHEIRTPLAIIRSEAELGHDSERDPRARFRSILEECARLGRLTDQLLILCREDSGASNAPQSRVELSELLAETVDALQSGAQSGSVSIDLAVQSEAVVVGAEGGLRQVFRNLLENAVKFTGPGGSVQVTLRSAAGDAIVSVRDTGVGIPPEDVSRIFDRFYQVDQGRSETGVGAGLGLRIVHSIVTAHRGRVSVESTLGSGCVFEVRLPLGDATSDGS